MDLDTVLARAEITDLLGKYCRGVDRVDEATLRSIYHDDAVEDRGEDLFIGPAQEWVGWTLGLLPAFAATHHAIQNILIDVDGDVAHGETYFTAYHRFGGAAEGEGEVTTDDVAWPEGGTELLLAGRYLGSLRAARRGMEDRLPQDGVRLVPDTGGCRRVVQ